MGSSKVRDDADGVNASEIRWALEDLQPFERVDLLTLNDHELLQYAGDLQHESRWLRELLHEALTHLHIVTNQLESARATIRALRRQERRP